MIIKHTLGGGHIVGLVASWSHALGIGLYAIAAVFGLSLLFEKLPWLFTLLLIAGGLFLAKLGIQSLRACYQTAINKTTPNALEDNSTRGTSSMIAAAKEGFSIAILNPKTLLFFGAIFTVFIDQQKTAEKLGMALIPLIVDGLYYSAITLIMGVTAIRQRFNRYQHWLNGLFGIVFLGYAIYLLIAALKSLG